MSKLILFIFLISILSSCSEKASIEGVWKLSYEIRDGEKTALYFNSKLFDFTNDSLKIVNIDMNTGIGFANVDTLGVSYIRNDGVFTFYHKDEGDFEMNVEVSQDSIIWSHVDTSVSKVIHIFKKMKPLPSKEITPDFFIGKSFTIDNEFYHDSIHFINTHVALQTGEYGLGSPSLTWDLVSYNGFDFLVFNLPQWNLIRLNIGDSEEILLGDYPDANNVLTMREAPLVDNKNELIGNWIEVIPSREVPPMPETDQQSKSHLAKLKVTNDSISVYYRNTKFTKPWSLTADGKRIYFRNQLFSKEVFWWFQNGSWKIIKTSDQFLTLNVYTGPTEEMGGDTIVLKRIN